MGIPKTFVDDNPEDRDWIGDVWTWLQGQPQAAWLYFARSANWDDVDWLFPQMVQHPDCDRALASWLFWSADPGHFLAHPDSLQRDDLIRAMLDRAATGGWEARGLHYQRVEVAFGALGAARALDGQARPAPFRIPRELCASFEGSNPPLEMDRETEADWQELSDTLIDVRIGRSDEEYVRQQRDGGNWWFEPALNLPANPRTTSAMSDVEAIDAVFGEHKSALDRIERHRMKVRGIKPPSTRPWLFRGGAIQFLVWWTVILMGGAIILRWLKTGSWM